MPFSIARDLYLRSMALTYAAAFGSLYVQAPGLFGGNGLLPVAPILTEALRSNNHDATATAWAMKSLMPFSNQLNIHPDVMLDLVAAFGFVGACFAAVWRPFRQKLVFATLFVLYSSLYAMGNQVFLGFQWDILLLESGMLAILAAPLYIQRTVAADTAHPPADDPTVAMFLVRWLLFRLMYQSGVVKLQSSCPTWWALTAMDVHYESQCIPTPLAYFAHQLPHWLHALSIVLVYVIEIVLPFFFFAPIRSLRLLAGWAQVALMLLIAATGNYNFFNFLTAALALSCFDDIHLAWLLPKRCVVNVGGMSASSHAAVGRWGRIAALVSGVGALGAVAAVVAYTVALFDLKLFSPTGDIFDTRILSRVAFTRAQFDEFNRAAVTMGMGVGVTGLLWASGTSLRNAVVGRPRRLLARRASAVLLSVAFGALLFCGSLVPFLVVDRSHPIKNHPIFKLAQEAFDVAEPWSALNSYGLFRRMTGVEGRPEVVVEGSADGVVWFEYNFVHKPGNITAAPSFCTPHQPRLDWQMWFAALGTINHNPWLVNLVYHLLSGTLDVVDLLSHDGQPFTHAHPPKFIRLQLYRYHYTSVDARPTAWWRRELEAPYLPALALGPQLQQFRTRMGWEGVGAPPEPTNPLAILARHLRAGVRAIAGASAETVGPAAATWVALISVAASLMWG